MADAIARWAVAAAFELHIDMESDWHVGTGAGRPGDVDRLVARDEDGLPVVPAKTVKGLWRQACERAAAALDAGTGAGTWGAWVVWLFGSQPGRDGGAPGEAPRPGALEVRAARLPDTLRDAFPAGSPLRPAITFVKPGVRLDPETGRALDDHLRFIEMARGGVTLIAACALHEDLALAAGQRVAASALLHAGAALLDHLGGGRRRGAGRCRAALATGGTSAEVWDWLEAADAVAAPPAPVRAAVQPAAVAGRPSAAEGPWVAVSVALKAEAPLLVAAERRGSVTESRDHIPGGTVFAMLSRSLGGSLDVAGLVRTGRIAVLAATPEIGGERGRPVPFVWFAPKGEDWRSAALVNRLRPAGPSDGPMKALREGHVASNGARGAARTVSATHNTIDDRSQRPDAAAGGLFTYVALAARQTFRAEVRLPAALASSVPWDTLAGRRAVGRSKRDAYGAVQVCVDGPHPIAGPPQAPAAGGRITVWAQSPLLLRDERLRPDPSLERLRLVLGEALGTPLRPAPPSGEGALTHSLRRIREEGWQVGWGLPRPTLVGIAPGSCAAFIAEEPVPPERWNAVLAGGIGERTAEGFGQVLLNDPLLAAGVQPSQPDREGRAPAPAPVRRDQPSWEYARTVERAAWRARIEDAAAAQADDPEFRSKALGFGESHPTRAQAGTLRAVAAALAADEGAGRTWCCHMREGASRRGKWGLVLDAFETLADRQKGEVWRLLGLEDAEALRAAEGDPREGLWAEAVLALVEACARGHQRDPKQPAAKGARA